MRTLALCGVALIVALSAAVARDDGRYAQSPLKPWFDSLKSKAGSLCCSNADGLRLEDPEWEQTPDGYRVKLEGEWIDVPDSAVVIVPNRVGYAMVWPVYVNGKPSVRCFMPGAGT